MKAWAAVADWVDRWYRVRWRALLTWVVLAGLMNWVLAQGLSQAIFEAEEYCRAQMETVISRPVPVLFLSVWAGSALTMISMWHQPLALRLGRIRSCLWIVLAMAGSAAVPLSLVTPRPWYLVFAALALFLPALSLIGRRNGWLWALPGAVAAALVFEFARHYWDGVNSALPVWWIGAAGQFPYAFAFLFGTRERPGKSFSAGCLGGRDFGC